MLTQYPQVENASQLLTFGLAILLGGMLCLVYDCYRTLILHRKPLSILSHCADIVYCIVSALTCFCFLLVECQGEIRIYAILGFVFGFFLVRRFCSKHIRNFIRTVYKGIAAIVSFVFHPVIGIVQWCYRKIIPVIAKLQKTMQLFSKNKEKPLANDGTVDV